MAVPVHGERARVRRAPGKQHTEVAARDAVLAAALTGTVAVVDDLDRDMWAGVVPLRHVWGEPRPAPDLRPGLAVPAYVGAWAQGHA